MGVMAFVFKKALLIMNAVFMAGMGSDYANLANNGQGLLQSWLLMGQNIAEVLYQGLAPLVYFEREFILIPSSELPVSIVISSYIFALCLLFIAGWVLAYGLSTFTTGNTFLYLVMRKHKDGENLLERKDKEEEQEEEQTPKPEAEVKEAPARGPKAVKTRKKKS